MYICIYVTTFHLGSQENKGLLQKHDILVFVRHEAPGGNFSIQLKTLFRPSNYWPKSRFTYIHIYAQYSSLTIFRKYLK